MLKISILEYNTLVIYATLLCVLFIQNQHEDYYEMGADAVVLELAYIFELNDIVPRFSFGMLVVLGKV